MSSTKDIFMTDALKADIELNSIKRLEEELNERIEANKHMQNIIGNNIDRISDIQQMLYWFNEQIISGGSQEPVEEFVLDDDEYVHYSSFITTSPPSDIYIQQTKAEY